MLPTTLYFKKSILLKLDFQKENIKNKKKIAKKKKIADLPTLFFLGCYRKHTFFFPRPIKNNYWNADQMDRFRTQDLMVSN